MLPNVWVAGNPVVSGFAAGSGSDLGTKAGRSARRFHRTATAHRPVSSGVRASAPSSTPQRGSADGTRVTVYDGRRREVPPRISNCLALVIRADAMSAEDFVRQSGLAPVIRCRASPTAALAGAPRSPDRAERSTRRTRGRRSPCASSGRVGLRQLLRENPYVRILISHPCAPRSPSLMASKTGWPAGSPGCRAAAPPSGCRAAALVLKATGIDGAVGLDRDLGAGPRHGRGSACRRSSGRRSWSRRSRSRVRSSRPDHAARARRSRAPGCAPKKRNFGPRRRRATGHGPQARIARHAEIDLGDAERRHHRPDLFHQCELVLALETDVVVVDARDRDRLDAACEHLLDEAGREHVARRLDGDLRRRRAPGGRRSRQRRIEELLAGRRRSGARRQPGMRRPRRRRPGNAGSRTLMSAGRFARICR